VKSHKTLPKTIKTSIAKIPNIIEAFLSAPYGYWLVLLSCNFKHMKLSFALLIPLFLSFSSAFAQVYDPVKWEFSHKLDGDEHAILQFKATIEKKWHVYSTTIEDGIGPVPTLIDIKTIKGAELVGGIKEPEAHKDYDPNFDMELLWFEDKVTIEQRIKLTDEFAKVTGELTYMTCDDSKCLPPEYLDFEFYIESAIKPTGKPEVENRAAATPIQEEKGSDDDEAEVEKPKLLKPVTWEITSSKEKDGTITISAVADIAEGWHVYSINLPAEDGPVATELTLVEGDFELVGELVEIGELHSEYDENFMMDLDYFEGEMKLERQFKATGSNAISGEVYFMCCDAEKCLPPETIKFFVNPETGELITEEEAGEMSSAPDLESKDAGESSDDESDDGSLMGIFLLSFIGGFAALLTPCVFPMIPMTVSFFTKQSKTRAQGITNAWIYGAFIVGIYTLLGFAITKIFGADALNALSTNAIFNMVFFVLLIVFAISFLGAFEITLPSSFVNKIDQASDKGGLIGIFFMAFTLAVVSFSCTGPIIGTLLVEAAVHGGVTGPLVGMFGFSLALALPFALFAAFPGWLNTLPQSGGWLNSVKVVLGFLEIGLAFKFLSNADLVWQAGWLPRELFIAIWIAVSAMLTLYLLGFIKMPHDSPLDHLSVGRTLLATFFLVFTIYLIPGLWGAPLKIISGFPPPMFYSEAPNGFGGSSAAATMNHAGDSSIPDGADPAHCPHGLNCFHDYEKGLAYAKEVDKPILLDFTGWACVNCRKMEEQVWSDPRVLKQLREDVVLISLYVDEKILLPEDEQYVSEETGKKVKSVGNKWADFQIKHFQSNSQPQYIIVDHESMDPLNGTTAYDPDIDFYVDWLEEGVAEFSKKE
jgi:thiol:disulfide interchange protein